MQPEPESPKFKVGFSLPELRIMRAVLFWAETGISIKDIKIRGQARLLRKRLEKTIEETEKAIEAERHKDPVCPPSIAGNS